MTTDFTRNFYALSRYISDSEVLIHEAIARNKQRHATDNFLQSVLGFEATEHSDAPPYILSTSTTKPQPNPCIDFGFEPTEGC